MHNDFCQITFEEASLHCLQINLTLKPGTHLTLGDGCLLHATDMHTL